MRTTLTYFPSHAIRPEMKMMRCTDMTPSFFANFCTDPSYPSGKCIDICPSTRGTGGNARVTPCSGKADSETWCCGESRDCCASGVNVVRLAKVLGQPLPVASSSSVPAAGTVSMITTSSATSTVASTSSTADAGGTMSSGLTQGKKKKKGLGSGAIAGIVIGALAVLSFIVGLVLIKKRRSKATSAALLANETEAPPPRYNAAEHRIEKDAKSLVELETPMSELPGSEAEKPARRWSHAEVRELDSRNVERAS